MTELTTVAAAPRRQEEFCEEQVDDAEDIIFGSCNDGGTEE